MVLVRFVFPVLGDDSASGKVAICKIRNQNSGVAICKNQKSETNNIQKVSLAIGNILQFINEYLQHFNLASRTASFETQGCWHYYYPAQETCVGWRELLTQDQILTPLQSPPEQ
jgi:hypothetical protein